MSKNLLVIACVVGFWAVGTGAQVEERTVIDNDRGLRFANPWGADYSQLGLYMAIVRTTPDTVWRNEKYRLIDSQAIKGPGIVYLQHHCLVKPGSFPLDELLEYEQDEVCQGRNPFFITATYEGQKKPVLNRGWPLTTQAVNFGDSRYVKFWVKNFIRRKMCPLLLQNWAIGIDNGIFIQRWYTVFDDEGEQHQVQWDEPFPQNENEWIDATKHALQQIKDLAPDLILFINRGSPAIDDMSRYGEVFAPLDGVELEGFLSDEDAERVFKVSRRFWNAIQELLPPVGIDLNRIQMFNCLCTTRNELTMRFLGYLIFSGPNSFFCPRIDGEDANPDWYAEPKNALGAPTGPPESIAGADGDQRWRLYWRRYEGGIVYLNLTLHEVTISLPSDGPYYDIDGQLCTHIALAHESAGYVTIVPGKHLSRPRINPRHPRLVTGPLTITLDVEPFTPAEYAKIVYTLDGSEPNEGSTVYDEPFQIYQSCVVKAKAFLSDRYHGRFTAHPSFTNFATYTLTEEEPTVEFHHTSDCGSEFLEHDYPVVSLSHVSAHPVTIRYGPLGGTARQGDYELEPGTLTIRPGEQHRYFYVHIVNDPVAEQDETLMISISDPVNATLGENTIYTYTIEDNDRDPTIPPNSLSEALDTALSFTTGGTADWFSQTTRSRYDGDAAQSGDISHSQDSWMQTTVSGTGTIRFYWKVSSEEDCDFLEFYIDGSLEEKISGLVNWEQNWYTISTSGPHTLEWRYIKDGSVDSGSDCGWVDKVEW